jgi:hypothetical protein
MDCAVLFGKLVRSVKAAEPELGTRGGYRQQSCFSVDDGRLPLMHRCGHAPVRFGQVLYWVRELDSDVPLRVVVSLFVPMLAADLASACRGQRTWCHRHMVRFNYYTTVTLPPELVAADACIACHPDAHARMLGFGVCFAL